MRNKRHKRQGKAQEYRVYIRQSVRDERGEERSMATQRAAIREVILNHTDLPVGREYQDQIPETDEGRLAFSELLVDAAAGKYSHLAAFSPDCLGKDGSEARLILDMLLLFGVKIRFASMPDTKPEVKEDYSPLVLYMSVLDQIERLFANE